MLRPVLRRARPRMVLKWFLGFRKLASPPPKEADGKPVKPDQTAKEANTEHEAV